MSAFLKGFLLDRFLRTIFVSLILFIGASSEAYDIYSFTDTHCRLTQGAIVKVTDTEATVLTLMGKLAVVPLQDVDFLVIHNVVENPIPRLKWTPLLKSLVKKIYVKGEKKPLFKGWAVKFVENLVIFYDTRGKIHVMELFNISKIRPVESQENLPSTTVGGKTFLLNYGDLQGHCAVRKKGRASSSRPQEIRPTRIIGDKIQLSEFMLSFRKGFERLEGYEERTYVYAQPFLYEQDTKLGFSIYDDFIENLPHIPIYFQWSTGLPYRFQSFTQIGGLTLEYVPTAEPVNVIRSDLKSHIFHATFVGNLNGLPSGSQVFTEFKDDLLKRVKPKQNNVAHSGHSFNYMGLMGADWGPWSASAGTYFPVHYLVVNSEFRELLSNSVTPIFRFQYMSNKLKLRAIFAQTDTSAGSGKVNDGLISVDTDTSSLGFIDSYSFKALFLRFGFDYSFTSEIQMGVDQIIVDGNYEEVLVSGENNNFEFRHLTLTGYVRHSFGEYVSMKAYANIFDIKQDYRMVGSQGSEDERLITYGGAFEFVF